MKMPLGFAFWLLQHYPQGNWDSEVTGQASGRAGLGCLRVLETLASGLVWMVRIDHPSQRLVFSPVELILDFWPSEL